MLPLIFHHTHKNKKIASYFCFICNYFFVDNEDFFMLHFSVYTWIRIDFGITTATRPSTVNVHTVAFVVANPLTIQWIELFVVIIILRVYCVWFYRNMSTIYTSSNSDILDNIYFILRIWKFDKFRNHISNNGTTNFLYNFG